MSEVFIWVMTMSINKKCIAYCVSLVVISSFIAGCSSSSSAEVSDGTNGTDVDSQSAVTIDGSLEKNFFPSDSNGAGKGDLFLIENSHDLPIVSLDIRLVSGDDNDGNGVSLFFDTAEPNDAMPPGENIANPGFSGGSGYRETESHLLVGVVGMPEYVFPANAPMLMTGDGAIGINFIFNDFDPDEEFMFGIDVDGFNDAGITDTESGQVVADGKAIFSDGSEATLKIELAIN